VHDVDGRLDACVALLRAAGFTHVAVEPQATDAVADSGFWTFVPPALQLYMIYARK
jgi:hypothetical protein